MSNRDPLVDLARAIAKPGAPAGGLTLRQGEVIAVTGTTLTITIGHGGHEIPGVHYLASYSPTVGDTVWLLVNGTDLLVLGDIA